MDPGKAHLRKDWMEAAMYPFHVFSNPVGLVSKGDRGAVVDATARSLAAHRRLVLLLIAVGLMGVADLLFTLTYMTGPGMMEVNPLARSAVALGGVQMLVKFKLFTLMLSAGILYCCRRCRSAEVWAWVCVGVMLALTMHWVHYNSIIPGMTHEVATIATSDSPAVPAEWVQISSASGS